MKQRLKLCIVYMVCTTLLLTGLFSPASYKTTVYAEEVETESEENPYTLQDFFAYMQHGYQKYNIFCENPKKPATLFATDDSAYEYRAINTDAKNVTGEIAVICNQEDAEGAEEIEADEPDTEEEEEEISEEPAMAEYAPIAYEIEKDESAYIEKIYSGSKLPEELTLTCIQADELTLPDLADYDLYIFEESARDIGISEEMFLQLDKMLKKDGETFVYGGGMIWDAFGTGEPDGSAVTVIENSGVGEHTVLVSDYNPGGFLVGISTQGNGFISAGTPKHKDIVQEEYIKKGYGYKWTSYLLYEQRLSYGILLFEPYTTIKVLPTYKDEVINRDIFKNSNGKTPHSYFRYINQVVLPSSVKTIPDNTFYNYDVLEKINLDYVTTIGNNAFNGCKLLKDVQFSKNQDVTIKESAFENCGLESVTIPGSVKKIGKNAFANNCITDPRSLEHYATTYEKYTEYQKYIKEHTADEEKDPSIKSVHLTVGAYGLDLEENVFAVEDTCQVNITHQPNIGQPVFEFTNQKKEKWEASELTATQLNSLQNITYIRSSNTDSTSTRQSMLLLKQRFINEITNKTGNKIVHADYGLTTDEARSCLYDAIDECADLMYADGGCSCGDTTISNYLNSEEEILLAETRQAALTPVINDIIKQTEGKSDLEKVTIIYDWLREHCTYSGYNCDMYGALIEGKTNCVGFSNTFDYLCIKAGLEAHRVWCPAHVFSQVKIDGEWYNCDVTWDIDKKEKLYFLCSDEKFLTTHEIITQSMGCTSKKYDNHKWNDNFKNVTFADTSSSILSSYTIQVENGKQWKEYLKGYGSWSVTGMDLHYTFKGWMTQDGQIINREDIIQLQTDITLYTYYEVSGADANKTYKINFYNSNKTIDVKMGTRFGNYDIPSLSRENDTFLGWSEVYPVQCLENIVSAEIIITPYTFQTKPEITLYPVFQSDLNDKNLITTTETLSGDPIYRLNNNNIGVITNYDDDSGDEYLLNQTSFNKTDIQNAETIKNKILKADKEKIAVVPKGYTVNTDKLKKSGYCVIKTNLELADYISALTYINCRYFQYLQLIQTPYFTTENELKTLDNTQVGYTLTVNDFEIEDCPNFCTGFIYFIQRNKFKEYYDVCDEIEKHLKSINQNIGIQKGVKVTDALWKINDLCIKDFAYDNYFQIYDLKWFLQVTDEQRNASKKADYHGVCGSYSKLAFALLGQQGYEAMPTAVGNGEGPTHSINRVILNGQTYYCDYCWTGPDDPARYMFMTDNNMLFAAHRNPTPDNMGNAVTYDRKPTKLSSTKIKSAKNQKGKKMLITFNKIKNTDGYEIQYATNSNFKSAKKKTTSKTKVSITKLKKNKTYYIRIRPYKVMKLYCKLDEKVETVKYYGAWSKYKKVRIKK